VLVAVSFAVLSMMAAHVFTLHSQLLSAKAAGSVR
jgi:hypothetical protein